MMRLLTAWCLALLTLAALGACSKEGEPPPPFNDVLTHGSQELPPVPLARPEDESLPPVSSARYLKKIAGPAGNPAEAGAEKAAAKPAEGAVAIVLNDSDAESLMKQFVELNNAGSFEATAAMFVPQQQAAVRRISAATTAMAKSIDRISKALKDTAPDVAKAFEPNGKDPLVVKSEDGTETPVALSGPTFELVSVTPQGDDKATATIRQGAQGPEKKLELERTDGKWRIREMDVFSSPERAAVAVATAESAAKAFAEVADKVEKNEIQPADVMKEVAAAMKRAAEAAKTSTPEAGAAETGNQASEQAAPSNPAEPTPSNPAEPTPSNPAEPTPSNPAEPTPSDGNASAAKPKRKPGETLSGRDANNEAPTVEEALGRQ